MRTRELPVFPVTSTPVRPGVDPSVKAVSHPLEAAGSYDGPRIGLVTLGCDKNTVDSERMMAALVGHGARVTPELEGADVVIINTCGFIEAAKEQSIETILEACDLKARGELKAVVAVGCMVQRYKDELVREIPEVDLFLGLAELSTLVPGLRERGILPAEGEVPVMERPLRILSNETRHSSFLKISEGCDHTCAFCAIPLMRGLHRSVPLEELVAEARALAHGGVREINVISQDTTWYGRDLKRKDRDAPLLPDLLEALVDRSGVDWLRLFYMYPSGITRELVELMARSAGNGRGVGAERGTRILPYLDMPLQHGSDRILAAMRRPERQKTIRERVAWLRDAIPDLTLRTTVIVGFPGETDDDFQELLDLLDEVRFDRVGAFTYSIEEGTRAAELPDQVPESLKRERLDELLDLQRGISFERNEELVGRVLPVLVDRLLEEGEADPDFGAVGRTEGQAADVDGSTQLLHHSGLEPGAMVRVEIVDAMEYDLIGKVVDS